MTVCPPIVTAPSRAAPVFADTTSDTVMAPLPDEAPENVIHGTLLVASQPQPGAAETETANVPPATGASCVVGET